MNPELNKLEREIDKASVERTGSAVDYSPFYRIALKLLVWWLRHRS